MSSRLEYLDYLSFLSQKAQWNQRLLIYIKCAEIKIAA